MTYVLVQGFREDLPDRARLELIIHNHELTYNARKLRKNMTKEEKHLWFDYLKDYPVKIQAQKVIGDYIVDFFCFKARLAIELDGEQHHRKNNDANRTSQLNKLGVDVIRFDNVEVMRNFDGVCSEIDFEIQCRLH